MRDKRLKNMKQCGEMEMKDEKENRRRKWMDQQKEEETIMEGDKGDRKRKKYIYFRRFSFYHRTKTQNKKNTNTQPEYKKQIKIAIKI